MPITNKKRRVCPVPLFRKKSGTGFTLIELLVVVAIIGLLSSIVFASLDGARDRARGAKIASDLQELGKAFLFYADDNNGSYPITSTGISGDSTGSEQLTNELQILVDRGYISSIPNAPTWPNNSSDYIYIYLDSSWLTNISVAFFCGNIPMTKFGFVARDLTHSAHLSKFNLTGGVAVDSGNYYCITE